jgi:hypothetical protein
MDHEIKERLLVAATRSPPQCVSQIVHLSAPLGNRFAATNLVSAIDLSPSETGRPASCDTAPHLRPRVTDQALPCHSEEFLYILKAGPAGGLRPPSGPAVTRRSSGHRPHPAPGDRLPARSIARHPRRHRPAVHGHAIRARSDARAALARREISCGQRSNHECSRCADASQPTAGPS